MITVKKQSTLDGANRFGSCYCCKSNDLLENYQILFKDENGFGVDVRLCREHLLELKEALDKALSE